jgi:hypothetical protein
MKKSYSNAVNNIHLSLFLLPIELIELIKKFITNDIWISYCGLIRVHLIHRHPERYFLNHQKIYPYNEVVVFVAKHYHGLKYKIFDNQIRYIPDTETRKKTQDIPKRNIEPFLDIEVKIEKKYKHSERKYELAKTKHKSNKTQKNKSRRYVSRGEQAIIQNYDSHLYYNYSWFPSDYYKNIRYMSFDPDFASVDSYFLPFVDSDPVQSCGWYYNDDAYSDDSGSLYSWSSSGSVYSYQYPSFLAPYNDSDDEYPY